MSHKKSKPILLQARQNTQHYSSSYSIPHPLIQAPKQFFTTNRPLRRSTLVIIENSPSPETEVHIPETLPTTQVASSSTGTLDKGKSVMVFDDDLVVDACQDGISGCCYGSPPTLFPTLGPSGDINMGHTQFIFDNSICEFVPLPPPHPFTPNQTHNPIQTQYAPLHLSSTTHLQNPTLPDFSTLPIITPNTQAAPNPTHTQTITIPPASRQNDTSITGIASFLDQLRLKRIAEEIPNVSDRKSKKSKIRSLSSFDPELSLAFASDLHQTSLTPASFLLGDSSPCRSVAARKTRGRGRSRGTRGGGRGGRRKVSDPASATIPVRGTSQSEREALLRETLATTEGLSGVQLILAENSHPTRAPLDLNSLTHHSSSQITPVQSSDLHGSLLIQTADQNILLAGDSQNFVLPPPPLLALEDDPLPPSENPQADLVPQTDQGTGDWPDAVTGLP